MMRTVYNILTFVNICGKPEMENNIVYSFAAGLLLLMQSNYYLSHDRKIRG